MSAIYDNWERLVGAVLKKEELWRLFHEESRSSSMSSDSSGFSFSHLNSSLDAHVPFCFSSPLCSASNHNPDDFGPSTIPGKDENLSPNKSVTFTPPRKRDLTIQVPKLKIEDRGFSPDPRSSRVNGDDAKQESYPLPLPPAAISDSSHPNSASKLPSPRPGSCWKKGRLIGRGPLGDVYLGFNSEKGELCAMEEVILSPEDAKSKQSARILEREIALLSRIKHPNIVQYYGSETVADNFYIYFEYVSGGSINMILQQYGRLGESTISSYTQQILSGLAYLHSIHIAHRDIKGASVFVDSNGRVKLCNFGIEEHIAEQYRTSWIMDSSHWMAPEVIMNPKVNELAVDIWSLGCTVLEMATSRPPLSQYNGIMAMYKIANHKELPTFPDHLSDVCKDFLRHCLQWNPLHRATASQLLEHPFVKNSWPLGKQILVSTSSGHPAVTNAVKSEGADHAKSPHLGSENVVSCSSKASKSSFHSSDIYTPRNASAPVSPVEIGAIPHPHLNQSILQRETFRNLPKHSPDINTPSYWDPNILRGVFRFS